MNKTQLLECYRQMVLIRRFEERCDELYQLEGKIKGFLHLYIGQEAIAVGTIAARRDDDHVITAYRDHGHALAVGLSADTVMAELMGKTTGVSGGRGGSMHMADVNKRFLGRLRASSAPTCRWPLGWHSLSNIKAPTPPPSSTSAKAQPTSATSTNRSISLAFGICPFSSFQKTMDMAWERALIKHRRLKASQQKQLGMTFQPAKLMGKIFWQFMRRLRPNSQKSAKELARACSK